MPDPTATYGTHGHQPPFASIVHVQLFTAWFRVSWRGLNLIFTFLFQAILKARVGRNVDGIDLNLYYQSLKLLQEFQADQIRGQAP